MRTGPSLGCPPLAPGDQVAVVSPASYPDPTVLEALVNQLTSWDLVPRLGRNVVSQYGYMAGDDKARADDLNTAIRDPSIRAIFATRGGAGSYRIADHLDWATLAAHPKPLIGFSDITHLHLGWFSRAAVPSIHGAAVGQQACSQLRSILFQGQGNTVKTDPLSPLSPLSSSHGHANGPLIGGNLRELAGAVGCGLPSLAGAILILEDLRHAGLGQVDRNLTQLRRSGQMAGMHGLALGEFSGFEDYEDRGWQLIDLLNDHLSTLDVPILAGLRAGHGLVDPDGEPDQDILVFGRSATLDCGASTITCAALGLEQ